MAIAGREQRNEILLMMTKRRSISGVVWIVVVGTLLSACVAKNSGGEP